ncbi:MAG: hypothetical protein K2H01_01085 [Ruminococcus sp.]|nr:hypothetical protein [Ruminococcus sp.]
MTTNTATDTKAIKDVLENVLIVYEVPETCLENVMMFIEGVKVEAKSKARADLRGEINEQTSNI